MRSTESDGVRGGASDFGRRRMRSVFSARMFVIWTVGITSLVLVLAVATGMSPSLLPLLVFLPAFVAGVGTVRQTAGASVWVTLVTGGLLAFTGNLRENLLEVLLIVAFGALSVLACRYRIDQDAEITRLRSVAAAMQRRILRPFPLYTDQVTVAGLYRPVEEDGMVGGDVYEALETPFGTRVLIADVQGKGIPSVGAAFAVLEAFRGVVYREPALTEVVAELENAVVRYNTFAQRSGDPERFVTALVLDINETREIRAVDCGHIPPHILYADGGVEELQYEPGVPLGLDSLVTEPRTVERFDFPPDSTFLLCTDGVTDARGPNGSFYPLEERLREWGRVAPERIAELLGSDLRRFTRDNFRDDIAVLTLSRNPGPVPAA